jgi:hypothetical protein
VSGERRLHIGKSHEGATADKLRCHGWIVHPWGQGLFADDEDGEQVRAALVTREPKTLWRWIPDLIAVKGKKIYLVDPKTDLRGDTPNFSLEVDAYMAHSMMRCLGLPIMYVWQDFTCNAPHLLKPVRWQLDPQRGEVRGSGTPFVLVRKADQVPFDEVFGPAVATVKAG